MLRHLFERDWKKICWEKLGLQKYGIISYFISPRNYNFTLNYLPGDRDIHNDVNVRVAFTFKK